jgi:hypothetical protein
VGTYSQLVVSAAADSSCSGSVAVADGRACGPVAGGVAERDGIDVRVAVEVGGAVEGGFDGLAAEERLGTDGVVAVVEGVRGAVGETVAEAVGEEVGEAVGDGEVGAAVCGMRPHPISSRSPASDVTKSVRPRRPVDRREARTPQPCHPRRNRPHPDAPPGSDA